MDKRLLLLMMVLGGAITLAGAASFTYSLVSQPHQGADIGSPFIALLGLAVLGVGAALRGE